MKLTLADGTVVENPDNGAIERALRTLDGEANNFAILGADELTYVQTEGGPDRGFVLEYQEGSPERHFRTRDYASSDEAWKGQFQWEKEEPGRRGCLSMLVPFP